MADALNLDEIEQFARLIVDGPNDHHPRVFVDAQKKILALIAYARDLEADRDCWRDQASERLKDWVDMRVRAETAEQRIRELEQDAARYRWLRSGALGSSRVFMNAPVGKLDDWIDAAMAASAKGGKDAG
ncbi:hypothetical protein K6V92_10500 [Cupriavidus respiraculi]|uniref:hypothetical protein n=1 Tax=Cupriavidus respiraculi TaxID=195930 RepID=UPI001C95C51B|nr:hypothetical protein [Cupriavidus respiraculi]MBY4947048.1 hypothetical protein [Cupriavidus respiraculi]